MNITKTQSDDLNLIVKIQISKEDYASQVEKELKNYQKKVVVKGFRQGKTPLGMVKKMYGSAIQVEEINKLISNALSNYIKENNLSILGEPLPNETEQKELSLDDDVHEFVYDIALQPAVNIDAKGLKIPSYQITVSDEMINKQIESICQNGGEMVNVDEVLGDEFLKGEIAELNADGSVKEDGVKYDAASFSLAYMKDEESAAAFKGAKVGQNISFNAVKSFPNKTDFASMLNISKEEVEKVNEQFSFTINEVKRHVAAEVNQDLFDKVYGKDNVKSVDEFRAKVKEDITSQLSKHSEYRLTVDIREALLAANKDMVLPEAFLKRWIVAVNKDIKTEDVEKDFDGYRDEFKWQVIKTAIIRANDTKVGADEMKVVAREIAAAQLQQYGLYGLTDEQLDGFATKLLEDEKQRERLYEHALDNAVYAAVKSTAKLTVKEVSMEQFENLFKKAE